MAVAVTTVVDAYFVVDDVRVGMTSVIIDRTPCVNVSVHTSVSQVVVFSSVVRLSSVKGYTQSVNVSVWTEGSWIVVVAIGISLIGAVSKGTYPQRTVLVTTAALTPVTVDSTNTESFMENCRLQIKTSDFFR